jgi:retron-type reverse transcriptase
MEFIEKHDILYSSQCGFREKHSTSLVITQLVNKITSAIDHKEITVGVFLDLAKAFDTIDHAILLAKLDHYGIRRQALQWIRSYFHAINNMYNIKKLSHHIKQLNVEFLRAPV